MKFQEDFLHFSQQNFILNSNKKDVLNRLIVKLKNIQFFLTFLLKYTIFSF